MSASGLSRANANRRIRQEAIRDQLAAGGHIEHVLDMVKKIADLNTVCDAQDINRLKIASELKMKIIAKYLPDVKQLDIDLKAEDVTQSNRAELEALLIAEGIDITKL